jgi:hypothetical protein
MFKIPAFEVPSLIEVALENNGMVNFHHYE